MSDKMRVISLGRNCWITATARICGYGGPTMPVDWVDSFNFKKTLDLFTTSAHDLFDSSLVLRKGNLKFNSINPETGTLYSKKYDMRILHFIESKENTEQQYQRRIERFQTYKDSTDKFLFIRIPFFVKSNKLNHILLGGEPNPFNIPNEIIPEIEILKELYSDDIFSHKFFQELVPKRSKFILLNAVTMDRSSYRPLSAEEKASISKSFYYFENVIDPQYVAEDYKKRKVSSSSKVAYTNFFNYINNNFDDFDPTVAHRMISM